MVFALPSHQSQNNNSADRYESSRAIPHFFWGGIPRGKSQVIGNTHCSHLTWVLPWQKKARKPYSSLRFLFTFHFPLAFPFPFIFLAFFLSSHFSVPRSCSLSHFPLSYFCYLFFPLLGKEKGPLKSQVIGAFFFKHSPSLSLFPLFFPVLFVLCFPWQRKRAP